MNHNTMIKYKSRITILTLASIIAYIMYSFTQNEQYGTSSTIPNTLDPMCLLVLLVSTIILGVLGIIYSITR